MPAASSVDARSRICFQESYARGYNWLLLEKGKKDIGECIEIARESIDSGKALSTFKKFVELNS